MKKCPPPEYQSWQGQPTPGACSMQEDNWGDEFWVNEEYQKLANLGASLQQFAEKTIMKFQKGSECKASQFNMKLRI
jgi:hypothetical protein